MDRVRKRLDDEGVDSEKRSDASEFAEALSAMRRNAPVKYWEPFTWKWDKRRGCDFDEPLHPSCRKKVDKPAD